MKKNSDMVRLVDVYLYINFDDEKIRPIIRRDNHSGEYCAYVLHDYDFGVPFVCSPTEKDAEEKLTFDMHPTNNLYYIISNGGEELNDKQLGAISLIRSEERRVGKEC